MCSVWRKYLERNLLLPLQPEKKEEKNNIIFNVICQKHKFSYLLQKLYINQNDQQSLRINVYIHVLKKSPSFNLRTIYCDGKSIRGKKMNWKKNKNKNSILAGRSRQRRLKISAPKNIKCESAKVLLLLSLFRFVSLFFFFFFFFYCLDSYYY